ncbi:MAG TPA: hypothetical protein VMB79_15405 [Jatrophihabitans sp.]|nr:hypothetical protein [Jatrophihabitans sp.]
MTEPGPLAEEAARLLGAAQDWLHRTVTDPATARIATGDPECCWCPLCQLIAAVRDAHPDLAHQLTEALAPVLGALPPVLESLAPAVAELRSALAGLARAATGEPAAGGRAAGEPAAPATARPDGPAPRTVHRIDLSGEAAGTEA